MLRLLVLVLVATSLFVTGAQQLGSDGPWWLELSRYLPFPITLAPALVALLLSLRLGWRWIVASATAAALFVTMAMGLVWHAPGPVEGTMRVMTYNTKAAVLLERTGDIAALEREILSERADIVVMQDANGIRHWRSYDPQGPLFGLAHVFAQGQYAIASRWPLRDCAIAQVGTSAEPLSYARCVVDAGGRTFELVDVHLESPRSGLNAARHEGFEGIDTWQRNHQARLAQSRALARALTTSARPLIVAGDLNAPQSSPVIQSLLAIGLADAFASAGSGWGFTYGHTLRPRFSFLRIDHILVSPEIEVRDAVVGSDDASDHRPVVAVLAWRDATAPAARAQP